MSAVNFSRPHHFLIYPQLPLSRQAAERAALQQQAVSRLEKAATSVQLETLQRHLDALGYRLEISVIDNRTGDIACKTSLSHA